MKSFMEKTAKKGFTLIELLIVIAIIGVLAVALLPNVLDGPKKARDLVRKDNVNKIMAAIESYAADTGSYPANTGCLNGTEADPDIVALKGYFEGGFPNGGNQTAALDGCNAGDYKYLKCTAGGNFMVVAQMESGGAGGSFTSTTPNATNCTGGTGAGSGTIYYMKK